MDVEPITSPTPTSLIVGVNLNRVLVPWIIVVRYVKTSTAAIHAR